MGIYHQRSPLNPTQTCKPYPLLTDALCHNIQNKKYTTSILSPKTSIHDPDDNVHLSSVREVLLHGRAD